MEAVHDRPTDDEVTDVVASPVGTDGAWVSVVVAKVTTMVLVAVTLEKVYGLLEVETGLPLTVRVERICAGLGTMVSVSL